MLYLHGNSRFLEKVMNYDALSLQAIQWITWISIGVGGGVALCTFIFGMISTASLSKDSTNNPIERLALGFVSRKRYMVLVTLVLLASVYGAASSMNYRATIIHTIVNGAQVIGIPSELLLSADGTPLRVIKIMQCSKSHLTSTCSRSFLCFTTEGTLKNRVGRIHSI